MEVWKLQEKSIFREYSGKSIIEVPDNVYEPIVNNIINKGDLVIMNGYPKTNKSTFAMQLSCNVSSGTPFLGTFNILKAGIVWYFSTEGKDNEFRERIIRMQKVIPVNLENIILFCSSQFKVNTDMGYHTMRKTIEKYKDKLPCLIIIDSVYSCFGGSLKDDETVNTYLTRLRELSELCNGAALFLYHHLKKPSRAWGSDNYLPATDMDNFGSAFFNGQADHLFRIEISDKSKMDRVVVCETQRSNTIVEEINLHLNEPDPYYLSMIGAHDAEQDSIIKLLSKCVQGLPAHDIIHKSNISKSLCYMALNELVAKNRISKKGYGSNYMLL